MVYRGVASGSGMGRPALGGMQLVRLLDQTVQQSDDAGRCQCGCDDGEGQQVDHGIPLRVGSADTSNLAQDGREPL